METFIRFNNKMCTVVNNEVYIILRNCKPRPLFRDRLHEEAYYLKRNRKTKDLEKIYVGY